MCALLLGKQSVRHELEAQALLSVCAKYASFVVLVYSLRQCESVVYMVIQTIVFSL